MERNDVQARGYLQQKKIPELFESLLTGLLYHQPDDHIAYLEESLAQFKRSSEPLRWNTFVSSQSKVFGVADERNTVSTGPRSTPLLPLANSSSPMADVAQITEPPGSSLDTKAMLPRIADNSAGDHPTSIATTTLETVPKIKEPLAPLPPIKAQEFGDVYFILGGPGSGKGTQCARIVDKFGCVHLSTGDLLREEVKKETEEGQAIARIIQEGGLVSSETIVRLLKGAMLERCQSNGFLIDGFPREKEQAKIFEEEVCSCTRVLVFKCGDGVMTERLKERGLTSGRADDNEETIRKRLQTFHQQTVPVISHYKELNKVHEINSEATVEEVFSQVEQLFKPNQES